ncbi:MAG: hypothetical protein Q9186_004274 [Xanthomendoza sp. 1 TL-2023]
MSTLRSRPTANKPTPPQTPSPPPSPTRQHDLSPTSDSPDQISRLPSPLDILRILTGLLLLSTTLSYFITTNSLTWNYRPPWTRPARLRAWLRGPITLTPTELSLYNGTNPSLPIYLALNGSIYDVTASPHMYGPGGMYEIFAGRDATRAFVTGCFSPEHLNHDLRGVEEMFVPLDDDDDDDSDEIVSTKVRKMRRERDGRVARKKIEEAVRGWEGLFDGGKGGKYFWVGRVDWRGTRVGGVQGLCEQALQGRPKRVSEVGGKGKGEGKREGVRRAEEVS